MRLDDASLHPGTLSCGVPESEATVALPAVGYNVFRHGESHQLPAVGMLTSRLQLNSCVPWLLQQPGAAVAQCWEIPLSKITDH